MEKVNEVGHFETQRTCESYDSGVKSGVSTLRPRHC